MTRIVAGAVVVGGGFGFRQGPVGGLAACRSQRQDGGGNFGLAALAEGCGGGDR